MKTLIDNLNQRCQTKTCRQSLYYLWRKRVHVWWDTVLNKVLIYSWNFENKNHNQTIHLLILNTKVNIWKMYWLPSAFSADYPCSCVDELLPQYEERNEIRKTIIAEPVISQTPVITDIVTKLHGSSCRWC